MTVTAAMEDYLEAIYILDFEKGVVRVRDIARRVGVTMPTVTRMLKILDQKGLVAYARYEWLQLTEEGRRLGHEIHRKHGILQRFLTDVLQIDLGRAGREACRMEHGVSSGTLERLERLYHFLTHGCSRADNVLDQFHDQLRVSSPREGAGVVAPAEAETR